MEQFVTTPPLHKFNEPNDPITLFRMSYNWWILCGNMCSVLSQPIFWLPGEQRGDRLPLPIGNLFQLLQGHWITGLNSLPVTSLLQLLGATACIGLPIIRTGKILLQSRQLHQVKQPTALPDNKFRPCNCLLDEGPICSVSRTPAQAPEMPMKHVVSHLHCYWYPRGAGGLPGAVCGVHMHSGHCERNQGLFTSSSRMQPQWPFWS